MSCRRGESARASEPRAPPERGGGVLHRAAHGKRAKRCGRTAPPWSRSVRDEQLVNFERVLRTEDSPCRPASASYLIRRSGSSSRTRCSGIAAPIRPFPEVLRLHVRHMTRAELPFHDFTRGEEQQRMPKVVMSAAHAGKGAPRDGAAGGAGVLAGRPGRAVMPAESSTRDEHVDQELAERAESYHPVR